MNEVAVLIVALVFVPIFLYFATLKIRVLIRLNRVLKLIEDWFYNNR